MTTLSVHSAPEISIIVPIYNVEKYLQRCIDSLIAQTFQNIEILLIDDGSTDSSYKICCQNSARDTRIRIIHQQNGGASSARNCGLKNARGKYIMFCDGDDIVSPLWCEHLYSLLQADESYVPVCSYTEKLNDLGKKKSLKIADNTTFSLCKYYDFKKSGLAGYICNSIFIKEIITKNNITFRQRQTKGDYNEDLIFSLQYIQNMKGIIYCGYSDYAYLPHDNSLSRGSFSNNYLEKYIEKYFLWEHFLDSTGQSIWAPELADETLYHLFSFLQKEVSAHKLITRKFIMAVKSKDIERIVSHAKGSRENPILVNYIKKKQPIRLWIRLSMGKFKNQR